MLTIERFHILSIFVFITLASTWLLSCETKPFPGTLLPVHPDAISTKRMSNQPAKGAKAVAYRVSVQFPATEIIEFYNRELAAMGYVPFIDKSSSRPSGQWSRFNSISGEFDETTKPPARYIAHWADNAKETWIWIWISYKDDGINPSWYTTAIVSCNVAKYSAYEESLRIIKLMEDKAHI